MPRKPLAQAQAPCLSPLPELDAAIPAGAGKNAAVGGKGQAAHPVAMCLKRLHAASRPARLPLPQPNRAHGVSTGEQVPIRAPGQREDRTGMRQLLEQGAQLRIPASDGRISPSAGELMAIGGKGQAEGALRMTARPEQGSTLDAPELDAAIEAPAGKPPFVRAEGERHHDVGMRLPGQVQGLAELSPQPHFATPTSGGPVLPTRANGDWPNGIEGLRKDALLDQRPGETRILHLDPLQMHAAQDQPRQIQPPQVPARPTPTCRSAMTSSASECRVTLPARCPRSTSERRRSPSTASKICACASLVTSTACSSSSVTGSRRMASHQSSVCSSAESRSHCSESRAVMLPKRIVLPERNGEMAPPKRSAMVSATMPKASGLPA